jgi:hypothetical protein
MQNKAEMLSNSLFKFILSQVDQALLVSITGQDRARRTFGHQKSSDMIAIGLQHDPFGSGKGPQSPVNIVLEKEVWR